MGAAPIAKRMESFSFALAEKWSLVQGVQRGRYTIWNNSPCLSPGWVFGEEAGRPGRGKCAGVPRATPFLLFLQEVLPDLLTLQSWGLHSEVLSSRHSYSPLPPQGLCSPQDLLTMHCPGHCLPVWLVGYEKYV